MNHPYEKYMRLEIILIITAFIIALFAILKGIILLLFISLYFIIFSFLCEALLEWTSNRMTASGKQLIRAIIMFFVTTYLFFHLYL